MKKKVYAISAVLALTGFLGGVPAEAVYDLDEVQVYGNRNKDVFGNEITEQSYYRTGGDVQVIDAETIEKRHYAQVGDALKHLPGVQVQTPGGYRGGEYGYTQTHSIVTINGDARVVVLVDGRRMDNSAGSPVAGNSGSGSKAMVDINQIMGMDNIEKIEIIKGPGASAYGADATGGVINIITKKGAMKPVGTLDFSMGSWGRFNYGITYSGSNSDGKLKYFLSGRRELSGESHYKDGITGKNYKWHQTGYRDNTASAKVEYTFDNEHILSLNYNYMNGKDDYPLTAPHYTYLTESEWERIKDNYANDIYGDPKNPGYRNLWIMWLGAYNDYRKNNLDLTYSFAKDHDMESFIRIYTQNEKHWGSFGAGDGDKNCPLPFTPAWDEWAKTHYKGREYKSGSNKLDNSGIQIQIGKSFKQHDLLTSWTFDKSNYENYRLKTKTKRTVSRKSVLGYVQDKIHVNEQFEITPALRYSYYSDFSKVSEDGKKSNSGSSSATVTPSLNMQYLLGDKSSIYMGYSKIYRPLRVGDYERTNGSQNAALQDEKGNVYTIGFRTNFDDKTSASVHYDYTDMSNAVARYSVWNKEVQDFKLKYVNAKETKKSFNLTLNHRFDKHWDFTFNYSYANDKWAAKDGMIFDPELKWNDGNVNSAINKLRPQNIFTGVLNYENNKFNASLLANYYTGLSRLAYTSNRFFILDLSANYEVNEDVSVYGNVTNLTNEAWENTYTPYLGMAAWPQPGRAFMVGAKYKF
ncbi:MAG: TonB-dependent receptor plug domain-containing protein [Dialister sp.]